MIVQEAFGGWLRDDRVIATTARPQNVRSRRGGTSRAEMLILTMLTYGLLGGLGPTLAAQTSCPSDLICYDAKLTHDEVIWAISDVLKSHGYEVEQTPGRMLQNQGGMWMQLPSKIILYVKSAWQGNFGWRYVAEVQPDGSPIALRVVRKVPVQNYFGELVDEEPYGWEPPDMASIRSDIRERLHGD